MRFSLVNLPSSSSLKRIVPTAVFTVVSLGTYDEKRVNSDIEPKVCNFPEAGATRSRLTPEFLALQKLTQNQLLVNSFRSLEQGWNGYNGMPIGEPVIKATSNLLPDITPQPKIFPTGRGTIQIEYQIGEDYFEAEISENGGTIFLVKNGEESEFDAQLNEIPAIIREFHA